MRYTKGCRRRISEDGKCPGCLFQWYLTHTIYSGVKMTIATIRAFARAVKQGSKYVYQTVPRLLTLWLDIGENTTLKEHKDAVMKCHDHAAKAIREIPAYKVRYRYYFESRISIDVGPSGILLSPRSSHVLDTPMPKRISY